MERFYELRCTDKLSYKDREICYMTINIEKIQRLFVTKGKGKDDYTCFLKFINGEVVSISRPDYINILDIMRRYV